MTQDLKPIKLTKYSGRNTFSETTNLGPTEFRSITNFDIYSGTNGDYLKTRRGSSLVIPEADPQTLPADILNKVVFPTNGGEWFIYNVDASGTGKFYAQREGENPVIIGGSILDISGDAAAFLSEASFAGLAAGTVYNILIDTGAAPTYTVALYDGATLVSAGGGAYADTPETVALTEEAGSGISGSFSVAALVSGDLPLTGTLEYIDFDVDDNVDPVDMKVFNDRVYVFSPNGNKIIYYDADQDMLFGRPMGLELPIIDDSVVYGTGDLPANGTWYYGLEKLILKDGADLVASSPNRKRLSGELAIVQTIVADSSGGLLVDGTDLETDLYWTHLRLWRSKNATVDLSDPLAPIDAQGNPDILFEVAIITRAEMLGTLGPIDTGSDLPPGNAGVEAGTSSGFYIIEDKNDDSVLVSAIGLDLIGLIPIPGCRTGTVNKGRIWASGIGEDFLAPNGPLIDPVIREDWLYTTEQFSQYQEQWDPQAYLNAGRDGDRTESLLTLLEDVIGFRSSTTKRVASGNPSSLVQMLDDKIGVPSFRCTGYIPGIGICAICSDGYFRYMGFDERWHQYIGKTEISQSIYDLTAPIIEDPKADFVYMNGKLLMLIPQGQIAALSVKEGKGWSLYDYSHTYDVAFNFDNGNRAALAVSEGYLVEIETDATTDADPEDDEETVEITAFFEGAPISGEGGLLEVTKYSFWGKLTQAPNVTAKSSNLTWQLRTGFIQPGLFSATAELNEREYLFEPSPTDVSPFKWLPLRGQFIAFLVSVTGPAMISWQKIQGRIRPTKGNLGVYPNGGIIPQGPGWANSLLMQLNFEDPADTFYDASGQGLNHTWATGSTPSGTKTNRVAQKPQKGVSFTPNGTISYPTDPSSILMGTKNLTWKMVFSFGSGGKFVSSGKNGAYSWRLQVSASVFRFDLNANGTTYNYQVSGFTAAISTVYALTFFLKKDFTGQFYIDSLAASSFAGARTTTRAGTATIPSIATGHVISSEGTAASVVIPSFYSIEKTDAYEEQAKRFWGAMKSYG